MKGGSQARGRAGGRGRARGEGQRGAVICVPRSGRPCDRYYTCGLYVKSLLYTRTTPTISVEKRGPGGEANIFNFREKIFQCGVAGRVSPARSLGQRPPKARPNWILRFAFFKRCAGRLLFYFQAQSVSLLLRPKDQLRTLALAKAKHKRWNISVSWMKLKQRFICWLYLLIWENISKSYFDDEVVYYVGTYVFYRYLYRLKNIHYLPNVAAQKSTQD